MKKLKKKKHRNKHKKHRNAASGGLAATTRRGLRMPRIGRAAPPSWQTIGVAVAGSVGSAIASGLIVNQKIAKPETISLLMAATGGVGAYLTDGHARVAFTGIAAAGAGQYALAALGKAALRKEAERQQQTAAPAPAQIAAPAPPAPATQPRQRANGGAVVELFRDAAADLENVEEDEWRYATRDDSGEEEGPLEIDLDEAA